MMTEGIAYNVFVAALMGGLAAFTLVMLVVAAVLLRRNRSTRQVRFVRTTFQ